MNVGIVIVGLYSVMDHARDRKAMMEIAVVTILTVAVESAVQAPVHAAPVPLQQPIHRLQRQRLRVDRFAAMGSARRVKTVPTAPPIALVHLQQLRFLVLRRRDVSAAREHLNPQHGMPRAKFSLLRLSAAATAVGVHLALVRHLRLLRQAIHPMAIMTRYLPYVV